ncbi:MAG: hypothetical protein P0Y64_16565 [Candidatus Sphingomonas colombiensis]|nr:hypothetical protein [Sphingomonas sp.]WEK42932.1 MAG: hypothetical protein P0Y64_16565 [Sphingomonas sp.]
MSDSKWMLVPVEPTAEMVSSTPIVCRSNGDWRADAVRAYAALLSAAPPAPHDVEGDIRVAIWNAAKARGMSQDAAIALVAAAMNEPSMKRALALIGARS